MRRADRKRRKRIAVWLGSVLLVVLAFGAGYGAGLRGSAADPDTKPPEEVTLAEPRPVGEEGENRLRREAVLVDEVYYKLCDRIEKQVRAVPEEWVGLDRTQLAGLLESKELLSFTPDRVVLFSSDPGLCPELQRYRTLMVRDGHVALFYGKPDDLGPLIEVTDIPVDGLLPADQNRLQRGILVNGQEEALRFLEGLRDVRE